MAQDANAVQALQAVAPVRYENGLVCGIEGYPPPAAATRAGRHRGARRLAHRDRQPAGAGRRYPVVLVPGDVRTAPAVIAIAGLAAVVAVAAVFIARRRSGSSGDGS